MSDRPSHADDTLVATRPGREVGRPADDALERGDVVGRYVVLSKVGAGGMGVVYAAYDPELDRKIALKLLIHGHGGKDGRSRLLGEAQALAKLQHPNVVTVHDVGTHDDGRVWLAMEFVQGQTLAQWCAEKKRSWSEVLDILVLAGRGVAAAHAASLLHRDLKPDNIMVGADGRVRVMDFGLARAEGAPTERPAETDLGACESAEAQTGALVGTPAYMAPEQFSHGELGPATDQFSYCVTLWQVLYGTRPFSGAGVLDAAFAVLHDQRAPPPRNAGVPTWLRRVLDRGLSIDPASRWPSMEALLQALAQGHTRSRISKVLAGAGVIVLAGLGVLGQRHLAEQRLIAACEATGAEIDDVWNDDRRVALRSGLLATSAGHATTTADKMMPWLDEQATAWKRVRIDACLQATVRGRWDADMLERASWCLDERRLELDALVTEFSNASGAETVTRAVESAAKLRRVEPCGDETLLTRLPPPPTGAREQFEAVRVEISRATALERTGAYEEGLRVANDALARAERLGWPPLIADARLRVGRLLAETGAYEQAVSTLEDVYFEAAEAGAMEAAFSAAQLLAFTVGYNLSRHEDGERWSRHADVLRESLPDPSRLREAKSLNGIAVLRRSMGAYAEAAELGERALRILETSLVPGHPTIATVLGNLAIIRQAMGAYTEAAELHERALDIRESALGPDHPHVATTLASLATARQATGAYTEAAELYERALGIREQALGSDHPHVASTLSDLANLRRVMGAYTEAAELHERALGIRRRRLGLDHPSVAESLNNLGNVRHATGAYAEAAELYEQALAMLERARGSDHPSVASSLGNLGNVRRAMGAYAEAVELYERALGIWEEVGPEHPDVARTLKHLGSVRRATGAYAEAVEFHHRALDILEKVLGPEHPDVAQSLDDLADVRHAMGDDIEAVELYQRALSIWELALGADHPKVAYALVGLARVHLAQRRTTDAVAFAERAVSIREGGDVPAIELAEARTVLARALAAAGDRGRAVALAEQARDVYREAGDPHREALAEVEAWLRSQGAAR